MFMIFLIPFFFSQIVIVQQLVVITILIILIMISLILPFFFFSTLDIFGSAAIWPYKSFFDVFKCKCNCTKKKKAAKTSEAVEDEAV